jgi:Spy/CpxP family protein refolding chaperone
MSTDLLEKAPPGKSRDRRWTAVAALLLVFLCGAAAGALAMTMGLHKHLHQPAFNTPEGKALNFKRLQRDLELTPAQSEQVESILNDFWQYYRTVLTDGKTRVEQVLTPAQREKFERILQESPK